ncbi:MAG: CRISPR-associated helicase Cas3' [Nitrospinae bacterium]|nr:CRISPR-associated helicase Cas3' [Nitrospinota bacterium]
MSNVLISHALDSPLKLKEHIEQVINVSSYLISKKSLHFNGIAREDIETISILIAACHDFGKATSYFQEYIKSKIDGPHYTGSEKDKSHSLISGLFGWHVLEKWLQNCRDIEPRWKQFLPFAVFLSIEGHHGFYSSIEDVLIKIDEGVESGLLQRQLKNIQPEIFSYKFKGIDLQEGTDFSSDSISTIKKQLRKIHREYHREPLDNLIEQRILGLLLYSILLEADKAYLAADNPEQYEREPISIPDDIVDRYIGTLNHGASINEERKRAYASTIKEMDNISPDERIHSITLPTGLGKTLLAASWAIKLRARLQKTGATPKIVISLPFLSIIEQTDDVYKKVFKELYEERADRLYTTCYSIADFEYKDGLDREERSDNSVDFFLSIWNSEVIVTTFDQLLYSIFSLKAKHLMRFHNLFDSILVFDEIQALPSDLWKPFEFFFRKLSEVGNTHVLLMSATQPGFFPGAIERVPDHQNYFLRNRKRVEVSIGPDKKTIDEFIGNLLPKLDELENKSVMLVLNTRPSSKKVFEAVRKAMTEGNIKKRPLVYLSSYVTPAQRIKRVKRIGKYISRCKNPLIISTQCIEAGVDIDVDYIIRDWAPLDSIFQVCGRCNRNGEKGVGTVEIVHLITENNKSYSEQVYDDKLLVSTAFSLNNATRLYEDQFYNYGESYFHDVRGKLGHSMKIVEALAKYTHKYADGGAEINVDIKKLLRGDDWQEQFIVSSFDTALTPDIRSALEIEDRWKRRYALKRLRRRIAENSVNVRFEKWMPNRPEIFADYNIGNFWMIDEQFYDKEGVGFTGDVYKQVGGQKII